MCNLDGGEPKLARQNVVVGLDIGTTKVVAIVGEVDNHGGLTIIGVGEQPTQGMRRGSIVDIEGVSKAISHAVEKAEHMSGCQIETAYVSISGPHLTSLNNKGVVAITNEDKEIFPEDVHRALQAAKVVAMPQDRRIVHIHPRQYAVDGNEGIIDPVGMAGARLEVETNIITASSTALQNILKCVQRAEIQEEELIPGPLASAQSVLLPAERELGCLMVDIGGGVTEFAIFDQGRLWYSSVLPVGGNLITNDIAVGLSTPVETAETIKLEYGCEFSNLMSDDDMITTPSVGGKESKGISKKMVSAIIEPRVQEILFLIKEELRKSGYRGMLPGGMVITGGISQMDGILEFAAQEMDMQVRIGQPDSINGISELARGSAYSTAIGLVLYGAQKLSAMQAAPTQEQLFEGVLSRIKIFFQDFFA